MGRTSPGVKHKQQHDRNGLWQLLRSSATTVFVLPLAACDAKMWVCAPIVMFGFEQNISCVCVCVEILTDIFLRDRHTTFYVYYNE